MPPDRNNSRRRIISALMQRYRRVLRAPPVSELEFLGLTGNHGEFNKTLLLLGQTAASGDLKTYICHVGLCWMRLALEHRDDAQSALSMNRSRSTFSRSYYAAYNASKAVRYIVFGGVSLKGDDHHKASDLPDDFPNVDSWSAVIVTLYEHRLLADYDNWMETASKCTLSPEQAFNLANEFVNRSRAYLSIRLGVQI